MQTMDRQDDNAGEDAGIPHSRESASTVTPHSTGQVKPGRYTRHLVPLYYPA